MDYNQEDVNVTIVPVAMNGDAIRLHHSKAALAYYVI